MHSTGPPGAPTIGHHHESNSTSNIDTVLGWLTPSSSTVSVASSVVQQSRNAISCPSMAKSYTGSDTLADPCAAMLERFWREQGNEEAAMFEEYHDAKAMSKIGSDLECMHLTGKSSEASMVEEHHDASPGRVAMSDSIRLWTGFRSRRLSLPNVQNDDNRPLETATAKPPIHIRRPGTLNNLADYDSFYHRYYMQNLLEGVKEDTSSATPTVPYLLRNELKSEGNTRRRAYRRKAKLNFIRYKLKKRRTVYNHSSNSSECRQDETETSPFTQHTSEKLIVCNNSSGFDKYSDALLDAMVAALEEKVEDYILRNDQKKYTFRGLQSQVVELKRMLLGHSKCYPGLAPAIEHYRSMEPNDLKTAYTILKRHTDIGPQWISYPFSLEKSCEKYFLTAKPFSEDKMRDFVAMSRKEKIIFYGKWCADEDGQARDGYPLKVVKNESLKQNKQLGYSLKMGRNESLGQRNQREGLSSTSVNSGQNFEVAFTILQRHANKVRRLWTEHLSWLGEQSKPQSLDTAYLTRDKLGDSMAMGEKEPVGYYQRLYQQRRAAEADLKRDDRSPKEILAVQDLLSDPEDFSLRQLAHIAQCRGVTSIDLQAEEQNRSSFRSYLKKKILPKPTKVRTFRMNKKDKDYFGKDFPGFFPTVSQLTLSPEDLDDFESKFHQLDSSRSIRLSNPPSTRIFRALSNLHFTTVLENCIQHEVDKETYFGNFPWSCQPYEDVVSGRPHPDATQPNPSFHVNNPRPCRLAFCQLHTPPKDRLLSFSSQKRSKSSTEKAPNHSRRVSDSQRIQRYGSRVLAEIPQISRSRSNSTSSLQIPPGYGPSLVPPRKPLAQHVETRHAIRVNRCGNLPANIRAKEKIKWFSEIGALELPASELPEVGGPILVLDTTAAKSDILVRIENENMPIKAKKVEFVEAPPMYAASIDGSVSPKNSRPRSLNGKDMGDEEDFGKALVSENVTKSLTRALGSKIKKVTSVFSLGRASGRILKDRTSFDGSERIRVSGIY
jgi:hypothetical protein